MAVCARTKAQNQSSGKARRVMEVDRKRRASTLQMGKVAPTQVPSEVAPQAQPASKRQWGVVNQSLRKGVDGSGRVSPQSLRKCVDGDRRVSSRRFSSRSLRKGVDGEGSGDEAHGLAGQVVFARSIRAPPLGTKLRMLSGAIGAVRSFQGSTSIRESTCVRARVAEVRIPSPAGSTSANEELRGSRIVTRALFFSGCAIGKKKVRPLSVPGSSSTHADGDGRQSTIDSHREGARVIQIEQPAPEGSVPPPAR